ncbi:hypothetical protein BDQ12DRAFT_402902 [Crucibulum laeve]|uniref:Uncharacterized protein n=1 Tax=Crucibulum laeve TaxID=68775 RepID=A0A5C3LNB8_9AGAR|nr:hypothetical protein BDQ12DRAFT_402902 [Crucibulum laeve]
MFYRWLSNSFYHASKVFHVGMSIVLMLPVVGYGSKSLNYYSNRLHLLFFFCFTLQGPIILLTVSTCA